MTRIAGSQPRAPWVQVRTRGSGRLPPGVREGRARFMLYSHDGVGLGHYRRNLVVAMAIAELVPSASVLLACAAEGLDNFSMPPGIDVVRLPGLRKVENDLYVSRRLRIDQADLVSLRSAILASALADFQPHVLLADKHPLGVGGELLPALRLLSGFGGRAALGLRDVLDDPQRAAAEWSEESLRNHAAALYELVLVYGSRDVLTPLDDGVLPSKLSEKVEFCGYVVGPTPTRARPEDLPGGDGRPLVLATVGGGEDGLPVLEAFVEASRGAPWRGVVVGGPQMPPSAWLRLRTAAADAGVAAYGSVHEVQRWYPHADALVSMGGYNTLVEALAASIPTICVPRTRPRREQLIRAHAFAARGLLQVVEPEALSAATLSGAIAAALATPRDALAARTRAHIDFGGAERAARLLIELAAHAKRHGDAVPV